MPFDDQYCGLRLEQFRKYVCFIHKKFHQSGFDQSDCRILSSFLSLEGVNGFLQFLSKTNILNYVWLVTPSYTQSFSFSVDAFGHLRNELGLRIVQIECFGFFPK